MRRINPLLIIPVEEGGWPPALLGSITSIQTWMTAQGEHTQGKLGRNLRGALWMLVTNRKHSYVTSHPTGSLEITVLPFTYCVAFGQATSPLLRLFPHL